MADALHDLGDSASLGLAWYFEKVATKKRDDNFTYGYGRFSLLAAFINGLILISGSIFILLKTIPRIAQPEAVDSRGMILLAILGVVFNGFAALRLRSGQSMNEKMVYWHIWEDILGWVAVLIGAILIAIFNLIILDPLISLGFTLFILFQVYKNLKKVFQIFMQGIPSGIDTVKIKTEVLSIEDVESVHDIHVWSLDGSRNIMTIHIKLKPGFVKIDSEDYLELKKLIRSKIHQFQIEHATIELELPGEVCEYVEC